MFRNTAVVVFVSLVDAAAPVVFPADMARNQMPIGNENLLIWKTKKKTDTGKEKARTTKTATAKTNKTSNSPL